MLLPIPIHAVLAVDGVQAVRAVRSSDDCGEYRANVIQFLRAPRSGDNCGNKRPNAVQTVQAPRWAPIVVGSGSAGICFIGFRRAAVSLLRVNMCVHAVDEDLVAVIDLGIILLGLDSGCVHDPLLHNASSRRFGCSVGVWIGRSSSFSKLVRRR